MEYESQRGAELITFGSDQSHHLDGHRPRLGFSNCVLCMAGNHGLLIEGQFAGEDLVNLDAVDHRSHIAFGSTRRGCPSTHPVPMPRLALNVRFDTKDATGMLLSSGEPATAHGDFWNTWDQAELERLVARCLGSTAVVHCGSLK